MTTPTPTRLTARRGDRFRKVFTLGNEWTGADLAEARFTVRKSIPPSSVVNDEDDDVVAQATMTGGGITFDGAVGTVVIPPSQTTTWPTGELHWDLQVTALSDPDGIYTPDSGRLIVAGDITRSQ